MLNALRHQWFGQSQSALKSAAQVIGAQRLAASVVWQLEILTLSCTEEMVLNALRHQWFGKGVRHTLHTLIGTRAQRLAASVVWQG